MKITWKNVSTDSEFPFYDGRLRVNPKMVIRLHVWKINDSHKSPDVHGLWGSSAVLLMQDGQNGELFFGKPQGHQARAKQVLLDNVKKILSSLGAVGSKL